ncbi:hemolysin D [Hypericibacter terrae]|uniref:Hemolysin D n=1 Tax=Hypericibacter terrae TaxID=2602015 RepID=A0A5J6MD47_9PROT|nr:efflux RND transporter periplasmic adaptor subunit [Hypericibacter terrae]QEX15334.1 hemolysin D [Hypericibacter terrae]
MRVARFRLSLLCAVALLSLSALTACEKKQSAPPPAPFEVGVVTLQPQSVAITTELPGRVSAFLIAQVRARVDGIVQSRDFEEGAHVTAGQRLYQIDPAPYQAALDSANAMLQRAQANLVSTAAQEARFKALVASSDVSRQQYDNAVAANGQAAADVAAGKAAVEAAQINLGYTAVTSPITGTIGGAEVTQGAYVQASNATLMATVQQTDPIYVDVTQSTVDLLRMRRELANGQLQAAGPNEVKVQIILDDGTLYPLDGRLEFTDITVDLNTGSVKLRAIFANPDQVLLPGMFVRARLQEGIDEHALLVPEAAVARDAKGNPTVMIVDPDNKVVVRAIAVSRTQGPNWIVESGLNPGDRVIVAGLQKIQPGAVVKPVELPPAPAPTAAATPTAAPAGATQAQ